MVGGATAVVVAPCSSVRVKSRVRLGVWFRNLVRTEFVSGLSVGLGVGLMTDFGLGFRLNSGKVYESSFEFDPDPSRVRAEFGLCLSSDRV